MSGVSLSGELKRQLCEARKLKSELLWRPKDIGDIRVMGYLLRKTANSEWSQPKRGNCIALANLRRAGDLQKVLISDKEMHSELFFFTFY